MSYRTRDPLFMPVGFGPHGWLHRLVDTVHGWRRRVQFRRHLSHLDDHLLDDIGIDRSTANAEVQKPFWRG